MLQLHYKDHPVCLFRKIIPLYYESQVKHVTLHGISVEYLTL